MKNWIRIVLLSLSLLLAAGAGCAPRQKTTLVVFAAGSLIIPFDQLEKAFEARHPQIDVQSEYHGSIQVMRHVTELHKPIDVVATADHSLIPMLMYEAVEPDSGKPYADSYIRFATNKLGIAYTERSKYAGEVDAENWFEVLARPDVRVGIADPRFDASGYRALMAFKLAEKVHDQPGLFRSIFTDQFKMPLTVAELDGRTMIRVPEILETRKGAHLVLRGSSIQLIALLQSGDLDYAFEYESVIQQHGLKQVHLPDAYNLSSPDYADLYAQVGVKLDFQRFATVKPEFTGEQIGYGITIPSNTAHPKEAAQFVAFVLGEEGREIMAANYHPLLDPLTADGYEHLPEALQKLCSPP